MTARHFLELRRCEPRPNWQQRVEEQGLLWHTLEGQRYWAEGQYLQLTLKAAEVMEDAANELHALCLQACERIIERDWFARMGISAPLASLIVESWRRGDPALYGRFDLAWNGQGSPKLLEYNADTPTSLLETALIQWTWKEDCFPQLDQLNSLHEALVERWQKCPESCIHFASDWNHEEDRQTTAYMAETAEQAGKQVVMIDFPDIGLARTGWLCDLDERAIERLFKLYPWEFLVRDEIFSAIPHLLGQLTEPIWKMLLSNKALLALLWELFPQHPLLLPAYFESAPLADREYVVKPWLGREGANVAIVRDGRVIAATPGDYADTPCVYQQRAAMLEGPGTTCVLGLWMVADRCCALAVREQEGAITSNASRFLPHVLV